MFNVYLRYRLGTDEKISLKDLINIIVKIIWSRVPLIIRYNIIIIFVKLLGD